jgi:prepilin-type processing-associated H-X9-DG protein
LEGKDYSVTRKTPCEDWKVALSAYIDGDDTSSSVEAHLAACDGCREWLDQVDADRRLVVRTIKSPPDAGFVDGVMAEIRDIAKGKSRRSDVPMQLPRGRFRWGEIVAAAAAVILFLAVGTPIFLSARASAQKETCLDNARAVANATRVYASDHWDHLPVEPQWKDALGPYVEAEQVFYCPDGKGGGMLYGFPVSLSGQNVQRIGYPGATLTVFDQGPTPGTFATRHEGTGTVGFLDGHATALAALPGGLRPARPDASQPSPGFRSPVTPPSGPPQ